MGDFFVVLVHPLTRLARMLSRRGETRQAEALLREALAIREELVRPGE